MDSPADPALTAAFEHASAIPGWLTEEQAVTLWREAVRVGESAHVLEIGSHLGRSTTVLASAGPRLTAIDPFEPDWRYGRHDTRQILEANLNAAGVRDRVRIIVGRSTEVRRAWSEPIDLLYIDGKHDFWTVSDDLLWTQHLPRGGRLLVHDAFSSLGVTLALLVRVLPSRTLRYVGRTGSLAMFEVARPRPADRLAMLAQVPWWTRNLVIKVLLRLGLAGAARVVFGHTDAADPY